MLQQINFLIVISIVITSQILCAQPVPTASTLTLSKGKIEEALKTAYTSFRNLNEGKNADYIPALAKVPSELFAISLMTVDGQVYSIGESDTAFSIQSISKVFTMAQVFQESGEKLVYETLGVDATGQAFNSIVAIEQYKGKEQNPLVNPGAIAATSMIKGKNSQEIWNKILGIHNAFAGRKLTLNQEVYKSEAATNQRNRAIAMLMAAYDRIKTDPAQATDLYTRACSINATTKDLAAMAATLANGGVHPLTKVKVVDQKHIKHILAVMATAGLYDESGKWLFKTGLPAKSGVGGGLLAVAPGKFGIAAFSPRLDGAGNSLRAQRAIEMVVEQLDANPYDIKPIGTGL